jgi:hypothetical protein
MEAARPGLQKIMGDVVRSAPVTDGPMLAWPLVCGTAVAGKTSALDCNNGILRVQVPDSAWRAQLLSLAPQYLDALRQLLGDRVYCISFVLPGDKKEPRRERKQS